MASTRQHRKNPAGQQGAHGGGHGISRLRTLGPRSPEQPAPPTSEATWDGHGTGVRSGGARGGAPAHATKPRPPGGADRTPGTEKTAFFWPENCGVGPELYMEMQNNRGILSQDQGCCLAQNGRSQEHPGSSKEHSGNRHEHYGSFKEHYGNRHEHHGSFTRHYGSDREYDCRFTEQGKSLASGAKICGFQQKPRVFLRKPRFPSCTAAARPGKLGLRRPPQTSRWLPQTPR